jgi:hypothetical protein
MNDDYCELCELPNSQWVLGMPPPPPPAERAAPAPRTRKKAAPKTSAKSGPKASATTSTTTVRAATNRRWTPPETFKPAIIAVLQEAGGALETDQLFEGLESVVRDDLKPADTERTPEGELRWRYAARRARVALIDEGVMTKAGPGVWQLAER